jgi:putative ATP-dependent endonuclease of the OLD family
MRLNAFSIENFRSITKARKIPLESYTLLVGPNNEGKSNILHALSIGMNALGRMRAASSSQASANRGRTVGYDHDRDFPVSKKAKGGKTTIVLEFELNANEVSEFKKATGSNLNGLLPISIVFDATSYEISISKQGTGSATLNKNKAKIAAFVARRFKFTYIPAVRTSESVKRIVANELSNAVLFSEESESVSEALRGLELEINKALASVTLAIESQIRRFLPTVKKIELKHSLTDESLFIGDNTSVFVDDGHLTSLERKGDGVQSLVALALLQHAAESTLRGRSHLIAVEEPEAHLHPKAIHELRSAVFSLSESNQVLVSSHSPLFVNRENLRSNIIVRQQKADCTPSISELRDVLGVRFSDNLQNAHLMILLEGPGDELAIRQILSERSADIRTALSSGLVAFDDLGGASSLLQKASYYRASACMVFAFLDYDQSGRSAGLKAINAGLLDASDVMYAKLPGNAEYELEDLFDLNGYADAFFDTFEVDLRLYKRAGQKWSDFVESAFLKAAKHWDEKRKSAVKAWLSNYAQHVGSKALHVASEACLNSFIATLEKRIGTIRKSATGSKA